jgi:hypothetical protein
LAFQLHKTTGSRLTYALQKTSGGSGVSSEPPVYLNVVFDTEVNVRSEDIIVIAPPAGGAKPSRNKLSKISQEASSLEKPRGKIAPILIMTESQCFSRSRGATPNGSKGSRESKAAAPGARPP